MFESLIHISTIIGLCVAFWMGYKAGRKEDKFIEQHIPNLDLINTEDEGEAPKSDEEIRKDMEYARTISAGYNFE